MKCLSCMLLFLLQIAPTAPPPPDVPTEAGLYYLQNNTQWIRLEPAPRASKKTRGIGSYVDSGGFTGLATSIVFTGARATMRIEYARPTFFVRGPGFPRDAILVRLTERKDSRALSASTADATVGNKEGFRKEDIRKIGTAAHSKDLFSVTPEADLKSGEYLLVFGYVTNSFDFAIDPPKK
jgi:hypothetical protein